MGAVPYEAWSSICITHMSSTKAAQSAATKPGLLRYLARPKRRSRTAQGLRSMLVSKYCIKAHPCCLINHN